MVEKESDIDLRNQAVKNKKENEEKKARSEAKRIFFAPIGIFYLYIYYLYMYEYVHIYS